MTSQPSPAHGAEGNPLGAILASRIRERGPMPFAEFMRECLYHPEHGYYSRANSRGASRITTPAWTFIRFLGVCSPGSSRKCGSVSDRRRHFWSWKQEPEWDDSRGIPWISPRAHSPTSTRRFEYVAVERSAARRAEHAARLAAHAAAGRTSTSAEIPASISTGCIFSNELLDALPNAPCDCRKGSAARMLRGNKRRSIH